MIYRNPTPITYSIKALHDLIHASVSQPDVRMLMKTMLDSIESATALLWNAPNLEQADHKQLMAEVLHFYAEGGRDDGERARAVFAVLERDRAHYFTAYRGAASPAQEAER